MKKQRQFSHCTILIFLVVAACGNSRRPGLSDKELIVQKIETLQEMEDKKNDFSNMEAYVIPQGIKYTESRAVDPANPPIVIDFANRKLNIKKFNLSDYYEQVRYIKLKHPKPATEGNFLFDAILKIRTNGTGMITYRDVNSQIIFTDDYIIAGDRYYGIHCYDKKGTFLYTIEANDFPKTYTVTENTVSVNRSDIKGFAGGLSIIKNLCLYTIRENDRNILCLYDLTRKERIFTRSFDLSAYFLDNNSIASYDYHPLYTTRNFLFTFEIKGDTLCRFPSYHPVSERKSGSLLNTPPASIYYYNDLLTIRQSMNDTIYRVVSPNQLVPVYVLNFGAYKLDVRTVLTESQPNKLRPKIWKETDRYILFVYTQGYDSPNNRREGLVKFFYSYFDKKNRQLYHLSEGITMLENELLFENPIPNALPFLLSQVNIDNNRLSICYSKKRFEEISKNKDFSSLPPEQQNRLKTLQKELEDNEVLIMILE